MKRLPTPFLFQLKSGDSYLRIRKKDGVQIFDVKKDRWIEYWQNLPCDVWLVIRTSEGKIRWMNATQYLKTHSTLEMPVKQIVFDGVDFNEVALLQMRDKVVEPAVGDSHRRKE